MMTIKDAIAKAKVATWFMVLVDGRHDLYLDNERETIAEKYADRKVTRIVGMGNEGLNTAQSVKIVLA